MKLTKEECFNVLNWRNEEEKYVSTRKREYIEGLSTLARLFMSEKQMCENLRYVEERAKMAYREYKLESILQKVKEERKRINQVVEEMNSHVHDYLDEIKGVIPEGVKPFEVEVEPYDDDSIKEIEIVSIYTKPFKISFLQERLREEK